MSSSTKVSEPLLTTSSGSKGRRSQYTWDSPPPAEHISFNPDQVGLRFGWMEIVSPERRWDQKWRDPMVKTRCTGCGLETWSEFYTLQSGKSKGCQTCSQPKNPHHRIREAMNGARSRCQNENDRSFSHYGGRGIEFRFSSLEEATQWAVETLGPLTEGFSIDRIDVNGHYERGNIRWATRSQQMSNQRRTRLKEFHQEHWPYSEITVRRKLKEGKTRLQIIEEARLAVQQKRKCWRLIEERLASMTLSIPDRVIGSRFPMS